MPADLPTNAAEELREQLLKVGFAAETIRQNEIKIDEEKVPLVAFSHRPFDTRTSCAAAISANGDAPDRVAALRKLGAPLIYVHDKGHWDVWSQGASAPELFWPRHRGSLAKFMREHRQQVDPRSIFRAKTVWRAEKSEQMTFVDVGFLNLIEETAGKELCQLVERMLHSTRESLHWEGRIDEGEAQWLVKANFWLLAAKILHDKKVERFKRLDLGDVDDVFRRVTHHYGVHLTEETPPKRRKALSQAVQDLQRFASLELISTESLAYVYENALITKETRRALGTHSTPGWLVEYVVARLAPWIQAMPAERRFVYEPACGHAPFLLGAMRLLSGLDHCSGMTDAERHEYLKKRLRGGEIDDFAREVARLSLTLADIPNHNGWHLDDSDMFVGDELERRAAAADIILSNPPFEKGGDKCSGGDSVAYVSKAAELLRRTTQAAQPGTLFGFILPQTTLDTKKLSDLRERLARECEWLEVCSLPDKVFAKPDVESAVLIGRKLDPRRKAGANILCRNVGETDNEVFAETGRATTERIVPSSHFAIAPKFSFFVPPLSEIWEVLGKHEELVGAIFVGQGFFFRGENHPKYPKGVERITVKPDAEHAPGFLNFHGAGFSHELPKIVGVTNDLGFVDRTVAGWGTGKAQIVMNYAPVRRGPWQVTAFLDLRGHRAQNRFLILRPVGKACSLKVLWAILNSPVGNGFLGAHSSKREILCGTVRKLPLPKLDEESRSALESYVDAYFAAAKAWSDSKRKQAKKTKVLPKPRANAGWQPEFLALSEIDGPMPATDAEFEALKFLHWRVDAEVLRLYGLAPHHERMLLDYFNGERRVGVPFVQTHYFPPGFTGANTLRELLAITADWPELEPEHERLVEKEYRGKLTSRDAERLEELQRFADLQADLVAPVPLKRAEAEMQSLKKAGQWIED